MFKLKSDKLHRVGYTKTLFNTAQYKRKSNWPKYNENKGFLYKERENIVCNSKLEIFLPPPFPCHTPTTRTTNTQSLSF